MLQNVIGRSTGVVRGLGQGGQNLAEGGPLATVGGLLANTLIKV